MKGQPFFRRLQFALHGLYLALLREMSFRVQIVVAVFVLAVLWMAHASPLWWAIGSLAIGLVMVAELANTALETLLDRLHPERNPRSQGYCGRCGTACQRNGAGHCHRLLFRSGLAPYPLAKFPTYHHHTYEASQSDLYTNSGERRRYCFGLT